MKGWIKLYRGILNHWIGQDDKYLRWWITILLTVNHSHSKFPVGCKLHDCNPGQSYRKVESWAQMFGCSKKTVVKFFKMLKDEGMIDTEILGKGNRRKHLLTVMNWHEYQDRETEISPERKPNSKPKGNPNIPSNKKEEELKNEKKILSQVEKSTLDSTSRTHFEIAYSYWELIRNHLESIKMSTTLIDEAEYYTWVDPIRMLIEQDKHTLDELREVYTFLRNDEFWIMQIRSTAKLRKKDKNGQKYFDTILTIARNEKNKRHRNNGFHSNNSEEAIRGAIRDITGN